MNRVIKHYKRNLIWMKLGIPRAEVLEEEDEVAKDEVDVTKMMLKTTLIKPGNKICMIVVKNRVKEIGPSQKWNASGVASTTTTQENADRQSATIVARPII